MESVKGVKNRKNQVVQLVIVVAAAQPISHRFPEMTFPKTPALRADAVVPVHLPAVEVRHRAVLQVRVPVHLLEGRAEEEPLWKTGKSLLIVPAGSGKTDGVRRMDYGVMESGAKTDRAPAWAERPDATAPRAPSVVIRTVETCQTTARFLGKPDFIIQAK